MKTIAQPLKSVRREAFAQAVAAGHFQTDAYRIAYPGSLKWKDGTAASRASDMARRPEVKARIAALREHVTEEVVDDMVAARRLVLADAMAVLQADPSDLMTYRRLNCRHCHGTGHAYRWRDEEEFWGALAVASELQDQWDRTAPDDRRSHRPELPTDEGGYGFKRLAPPSLSCPKCEGEGIEDVRFADVRTLTGHARRLYSGVQVTKDGTKMLTRDQDAARLLLARAAGMLVDKVQHTGAVGLYPMQISDEQRARILKMIEDEI